MAKLVILNQGMTGRMHELNVDRTTIGRVEDNTFQIADPSVSSHHCEAQLRGEEVFIRDLNSTNGCFINSEKITEGVLKPGQTLRLGQVELRLIAEGAAAPPPATPAPAPAKKPVDSTMVIPRGVSLGELEKGGRPPSFDSTTAFSKKKNRVNTYFIIGGIIIGILILVLIIISYMVLANSHK
ncbi:MAG TPA: FHA domain-containing protein [Candidatus Aquilonibacter sp.]|nr:FHA domain-containing protein [Candidatus Aquilonibacter sp.]